jgi:hypothetical protein
MVENGAVADDAGAESEDETEPVDVVGVTEEVPVYTDSVWTAIPVDVVDL